MYGIAACRQKLYYVDLHLAKLLASSPKNQKKIESGFMDFKLASNLLHSLLEAAGYWVRKRSVLPFGIDYQHDIRRMSEMLGIPINVFCDVGAHTGETATQALDNFPEAKIYSFEPHPKTFSFLANAVRNPRFEAINLAISDASGTVPFFEYGTFSRSNSMVADSQYAVRTKFPFQTLNVEATSIDEFCRDRRVDRIDILKIDTEGHELAVLQGAKRLLENGSPMFVYAEFNSVLPQRDSSGGALAPLSNLLEPNGFQFVATYPEYMVTTEELFVVSNVLYVRPPKPGQ